MPSFTVTPNEEPSIPRDGLHFWFDPLYQSNRTNDQISFDKSGNYSNFTFSNQVSFDSSRQAIKFDGGDFIDLPISVHSLSSATVIYWSEFFNNDLSWGSRGNFGNTSPGNNTRFNIRHTIDAGGGAPNRLIYDWATASSVLWDSNLVPPHHGTFMVALSLNSTGATISLFEGISGTKRTYRHSQSHSSMNFTQSSLGRHDSGGGYVYSQQYYYKFYFWTRNLSDTEVNRVFNITKPQIPIVSDSATTSYLIRVRIWNGFSEDSKATVCTTDEKNPPWIATNYYSNVPVQEIGTGSYLWTNQQRTSFPGSTFASLSYLSPKPYVKINTSTGEVQEWGPC